MDVYISRRVGFVFFSISFLLPIIPDSLFKSVFGFLFVLKKKNCSFFTAKILHEDGRRIDSSINYL